MSMGKKCNHSSFWDIYKAINFKDPFSSKKSRSFKCSKCGAKCKVKFRGQKKMRKDPIKKYFTYFLWLLPALILIYLVYKARMNYLDAILWVIFYHFIAMVFIINSSRLKVSKK